MISVLWILQKQAVAYLIPSIFFRMVKLDKVLSSLKARSTRNNYRWRKNQATHGKHRYTLYLERL
jgi:hypothetical protein